MQPSSLIFVVIVAIWVAYLVQHWVRRREHLATARSVDKFSEAMRVLERRTPLLAGAPTGSTTSPLRTRVRAGGPAPAVPHPVPALQLAPHRSFAGRLVRRMRGVFFLASVLAVPATVVLSAVHVLKWLSVGIAVGAVLVAVALLRIAAIREQAARRSRRLEARRLQDARERLASVGRGPSFGTRVGRVRTETTHTPVLDDSAPVVARAETTLAPGEWRPVPVPTPTYMLKETAVRRESRRPEGDRPVPIEVEDDDIELMVAQRRRVAAR